MKKAWKRPKLIVLVRGKSEETVLVICKYIGLVSGPKVNNLNCLNPPCTSTCEGDVET